MFTSQKSIITVILEAAVVGICLILFVFATQGFILPYIPKITETQQLELLFISGFLFHIVFEYTKINEWYSREYCKLL